MPSSIVQRVIGGVTDTRISLSNSNFARAHGVSSWTKLRMGVRFIMSDIGAGLSSTPRFSLGFCSGTTNLLLDSTTTHFFGIMSNSTSWTYTAVAGGVPASYNTQFYSSFKSGTNLSLIGFQGSLVLPADVNFAGRRMIFVDVTRGASLQLNTFIPTAAKAGDTSASTFLACMEQSSPVDPLAASVYQSTATLTDTEASGVLDCVTVAWNMTNPTVEICDLAVARLA